MPLRLIASHDPAFLLRAAADAFLTPCPASPTEPFPSPAYLLALRQGALRDDLFDLAADSNIPGWFDAPLCIFHELPRWLGVSNRTILGEYERAVLIGRILRETGSEIFAHLPRPDLFVDSVDTLFGELLSNGVSPFTFSAALERRTERDDFEKKRDADLSRAYQAYTGLLTTLGKADGRDEWQYCAAEISAGRANLAEALGGRREIRIFGLADLRRGWRTLLSALAASPAIDSLSVYSTTASLELGVAAEQLPHESTGFVGIAARLFAEQSSEPAPIPQPNLLSSPDVEREHDEIARRVRALIDAGAAPNRIAIVSRKARPHVDYAVSALARVGVPAMARQRFTLAAIPAIRALRTLFRIAADGWTRAGLIELARQPYIDCALEPRVINYIGFRKRVSGLEVWEKALRELEQEARIHEERVASGEEHDDRGHSPPPSAVVTATREAFGRFARDARALVLERPMSEWLQWLDTMLARDTFRMRESAHRLAAERYDVVRRDLAALDGAREIVRQWSDALSESVIHDAALPNVTVARFDEELTAFLSGDAALWTPACQGVQVLEGPAAAYRSFDHLFIVGMQGGAFPALAPESCVLDKAERESLAASGLPIDTGSVWDEREQELFRVLVAGARRSLTISFSRMDEMGREVVPSSLVDALNDVAVCAESMLPTSKVVIEGVPMYAGASALDQAEHGAAIERIRATGALSPYNGAVESTDLVAVLAEMFGNDRKWSPTQLEELAKCPWAYFSKRVLRLEHLGDPDEDMDAATRGSVLHLALHQFYKEAKEHVGGPVFLLESDSSWARPMLSEALDKALDESSWKWLGHPVLQPAHRAELWRILEGFAEWEIELHRDMLDPKTRKKVGKTVRTAADEHELAFEDMVYEQDGVRIRYRGSIDRVDVSVDDRAPHMKFVAAIDYKSSVYSTPGSGAAKAWDQGVVLQVPLYAHALRTLRPEHEIARVEYQTLKKPDQVHSLELYTIDKKTKVVSTDPKAVEQWHGALDHAIAHVKRARAGEFPAAPPECCKCPPWCHGRDICRIQGGPRELR